MNTIVNKFESMGARLNIREGRVPDSFSLDVRDDRNGQFFELLVNPQLDHDLRFTVVDVQPQDRHLLLQVRNAATQATPQKFLCGHDERFWFVAAVPERRRAANVEGAKEALKPAAVVAAQTHKRVKRKKRNKRRNKAFVRQGEWFFVPAPELKPKPMWILKNEPLSRGIRSKPHVVEELCRFGGETVYVCQAFPRGVRIERYRKMARKHPDWQWTTMTRDPQVYARGKVRHPDHKTIVLRGWHRVLMNTENESQAMRQVVFLD